MVKADQMFGIFVWKTNIHAKRKKKLKQAEVWDYLDWYIIKIHKSTLNNSSHGKPLNENLKVWSVSSKMFENSNVLLNKTNFQKAEMSLSWKQTAFYY